MCSARYQPLFEYILTHLYRVTCLYLTAYEPRRGARATPLIFHSPPGSVGVLFSRAPSGPNMAPRRTEYELTVEQELPAAVDGAPRRARLTARFSGESDDVPLDDAELARSLRDLSDRLARASEAAGVGRGPASMPHPDRPLEELLETYRPRQIELVELLHADGELTDGEYAVLRTRVMETSAGVPAPKGPLAPMASPRTGSRSVEELLRTYQIASLRQAGAVRARRQISFEEYMSLKRHFASSEAGTASTASIP